MLEAYVKDFDPEEAIRGVMRRRHVKRTEAEAILRRKIPKESYYQDKIKRALQKRYPHAYIAKIAQGEYSQGGIPDILFILDGHYFAFEVKRPIFGELSKLQIVAIKKIRQAGGTAAVVSWPEEAINEIDAWRTGKGTSER